MEGCAVELNITVNDERLSVPAGTTVAALLGRLGVEPVRVAVERNLQIVRREDFPVTVLQDGDVLEIVHFVGGG